MIEEHLMVGYAYALKEIAENAGLKSVPELVKQPGIRTVHRVTIQYYDRRAVESVVTVKRMAQSIIIERVHPGCFGGKVFTRQMMTEDYGQFTAVIGGKAFDLLHDQETIPLYGVDLCLVERASGTFTKSVVFSLKETPAPYDRLLETIKRYLPEALREVRP